MGVAVIEYVDKIHNFDFEEPPWDGEANYADKLIKTPYPETEEDLAVGFHEIGHIFNGRLSPAWWNEYKAVEYSIIKCREYQVEVDESFWIGQLDYIKSYLR